ncbi:MAG: DNA mismatch repair endonuclease MutL [Candidatus Poseidoniaceae archaeon]|nr:DNA mismatch repair endonuclease MutL [Candidatus Poseidoniaceae archaeon]
MSEPNVIVQLDQNTIGHIAAGEVVERPAQVVKELIENSLDAGSSQIKITIERGGFDVIKIEDNGGGIREQDLTLSLDRHATSKLKSADDLQKINTLGFRGEALASIGIVSRLTVASRPKGREGRCIKMDFGTKKEVEPYGMAEGTTIEVKSLFENTPARLSFQRRPATENSRIVDVVVSHAMAHIETGFKLVNDERTILDVPKSENLAERLYDILGRQADRMIELKIPKIDEDAPGNEKWKGWISTPDITRGKGDDIYILINERPVASGPFQQAIRRGYRTRLMQGRHPVAVLSLEIPPDEVDVNVHPTKREVRLKHSWRVLERLERAISNTLEEVPTNPDSAGGIKELEGLNSIDVEPVANIFAKNIEKPDISEAAGINTAILPSIDQKSENVIPSWAIAAGSQLNLHGSEAITPKDTIKARPVSSSQEPQQILPGMQDKPISPALSSAERELHRYSKIGINISPNDEQPLEKVINDLPKMEPLAQFADSYILAQADEELLLIDQHALHERIRFERLRYDEKLWNSQKRLEPMELDFDAKQNTLLESSFERLKQVGFEFEQIGESWKLISSPNLLKGEDMIPFLIDLLQDCSEDGAPLETVENRKDHLAFLNACRGAVKANQKLTLPEMRRLLDDMRKIPNPWACVHGRPTALRLPIHSLDHHFGRHG